MLQQIRFQNLGLFDDKTCHSIKLDTNDDKEGGIAILVGENGSGKSSVFEFVRRCMSTEITKSESNKYKQDQVAFVKCNFIFEDKPLKELKDFIKPSSLIKARRTNGQQEGAEYLSKSLEKYTSIDATYKKTKYVSVGVIYDECATPNKYRFMHLVIKGAEESNILLLERTLTSEAKDFMAVKAEETKKTLKSLDSKSNPEPIVEKLIEKFDTMLNDYQEQSKSSEERHVKKFVEAVYAKLFGKEGRTSFLFAHRGIGPLDSSLSDKMARGQQNYEDTVNKAELMAMKLGKFNDDQRKKYIDISNKILGYGETVYDFKPFGKNNVIMVDKKNDNASVNLLKTPEGVYEAHVIAILLAEAEDNRYITLCLDEPNKCMHPAQVERLRETMLQTVKKGCSIIVSTHSRDMISFDTWKHVHYFKRYEGEPRANLTFTRVPIDDPRYQDSFTRGGHPYRDALFARRCLFVEGISDYRFFKVLIEEWQDPILKDLTIIELCGADNSALVHRMCKESKIPHIIWLDGDKYEKYKSQPNTYFWKKSNLECVVNQHLEENMKVKKGTERDVRDMKTEDLRVVVIRIKEENEFRDCRKVLQDPNNFKIKEEIKGEAAAGVRKRKNAQDESKSKKAKTGGGSKKKNKRKKKK